MSTTNHTISLDETITISPTPTTITGTTLNAIDLSGVSMTTSGQGYSPTYSISGSNLSNTVWTTTGTGSSFNWPSNDVGTQIGQSGKITLKGKDADVDINGKSLKDWMDKVEERLNILTPNPELEKEWDELRRLGERYRKLEKKCKEKAEVWKKLKQMPPPTPD